MKTKWDWNILCVLLLMTAAPATSLAAALPALRVSDNHRFLVTSDGQPFFWLGDTAWELFHRLNREDAISYLEKRAGQGFTVVQAVALAEFDGLNVPNAYGHKPLLDNDPTRPDVKDGPDNDYWDHVDFIVAAANQRGIYVGFLPTWGDKWNKKWGVGPEIFTRKTPRLTVNGWDDATGMRASCGFSAATGQWKTTRTRKSRGLWLAACAKATAARTS